MMMSFFPFFFLVRQSRLNVPFTSCFSRSLVLESNPSFSFFLALSFLLADFARREITKSSSLFIDSSNSGRVANSTRPGGEGASSSIGDVDR